MKLIKNEQTEKNTVKLTIEVDKEAFEKALEKSYKKNVKQIHNLVLTHPDADHCGGADYVMAKYKVKNIYMTTYQSKSNEYKEVLDAIKKYKVKRTNVKKGSTIDIGGIKAKVLSADVKADNPNDSSIVLKVVHNKKSFLFTGDIGAKVENQLVDKSDVNVDVLKVSHHGSDYSSAIRFIKATSPTYSVISVGKNNRYGHPVNTVLKRLEKYSKEILRTDRNGSIVITSTGTKLSYKTEKKTTNNSSTSSKPSGDSSSTAGISSLTNSSVVYITATGSKFHKKKCGSGTYKKTTYGKVKNTKLTPCKKCFG